MEHVVFTHIRVYAFAEYYASHILGGSLVLPDGFAAATRFKCLLERCRLWVFAWPKLPRSARICPRPWFSSGLTEMRPSRNVFASL
jgi:hypothetical protein